MANDIKLEVYTFRIRKLNSLKDDNSFLPLDNFNKSDFWEAFKNYLSFVDKLLINNAIKKALRLKEKTLTVATNIRTYSGIFESGGYGIESDIYKIEGFKHKVKKNIDDVEIMPFYFLIHIPKKLNVGILIIQRTGIYGISLIVRDSISKYFRENFQDYIMDFQPFISKELAETFIDDGGVKEIIYRRYSLPEDKAELLNMKEYREEISSVELRIKAKGIFSGFNKKLKKFIKDPNSAFFDIPGLKNIGFDEDTSVSVVSKLDGVKRTVDLSDTMQIRPYYNIDDEVEKEKTGHPSFKSIDSLAKNLLLSFKNENENQAK